ncbi:MAG: hypothetical protein WCP97_00740 [bacterium]
MNQHHTPPPPPPPHSGQPPAGASGIPPADIFGMLGLEDLPENEKKVLLEKLEKVIQEQVIHLIVTQLTDEQCQDLNEKMDQGLNQMQVIEYLRGTIPNLEDQIRKLVEDFREDLLVEVDDIRKELASGKKPSSQPVSKRFKEGYVQPGAQPGKPAGVAPQQPTHPQQVPPEVLQHLQQINHAIQEATKVNNYEVLIQLMNQRKALKAQWGIAE